MLRQTITLKQGTKLSPLQMKLMKLIQLPQNMLEQKIKEELMENPALEEGEEAEKEDEKEEEDEFNNENAEDQENESGPEDEINIDEYIADDEIPDYRTRANNNSPDEERKSLPVAVQVSFQDYLLNQTTTAGLDDTQHLVAEQIIGSLDDDGYLRRPLDQVANDLAFSTGITIQPDEIERVLKMIQGFDPPGIGARNLKECLLLQIKRKEEDPVNRLGTTILTDYFEEFTNKNYAKIIRETELPENEIKEAIQEILKLNPKPGESSAENFKTSQAITPDFVITAQDGKLDLLLNTGNVPELRVSRQYRDMLEGFKSNPQKSKNDREAIQFVKHKLEAARGFIDAIQERHHTLISTMNAIMEIQKEFFLTGDETKLKAMVLRDVESLTGYDKSTVSRVTNSKYVQTPYGTYLLKFFFSEKVKTEDGEEASAREVKRIMMDLVDAEDKHNPMTDLEIMAALKEKNYKMARRTVAKYRDLLKIPPARLRKVM